MAMAMAKEMQCFGCGCWKLSVSTCGQRGVTLENRTVMKYVNTTYQRNGNAGFPTTRMGTRLNKNYLKPAVSLFSSVEATSDELQSEHHDNNTVREEH
jgi:hypothetical protein